MPIGEPAPRQKALPTDSTRRRRSIDPSHLLLVSEYEHYEYRRTAALCRERTGWWARLGLNASPPPHGRRLVRDPVRPGLKVETRGHTCGCYAEHFRLVMRHLQGLWGRLCRGLWPGRAGVPAPGR